MAKEGKKTPGFVDVKNISLISIVGEVINLNNIVGEVNIYQSLNAPFLKCNIVISDATSLFDTLDDGLGFTGQEILILRYTTKFPEDKQKDAIHAFVLHEVSFRERSKEKEEVLIVEGISIEGYLNLQNKISRAYGRDGGNTISNIVKSIVDEHFKSKSIQNIYQTIRDVIKVPIQKTNTFDPTRNKIKFISPNVSPIRVIRNLVKESDNDTIHPLFCFYEDTDGYHFSDFKKLLDKDVTDTFSYEPSNYMEGGSNKNMIDLKKIIEYNVVNQTSMMENINRGLYGSKTINMDVLRKRKKEINFDYNTTAPKFAKLNNKRLIQGNSYGGPNSKVMMFTSREGHDSDNILKPEKHIPKRYPQFAGISSSFLNHISNIMLNVSVHGNSDLNVGNKINLIIPQATNIGEQDGQVVDKYLSGFYMIKSLRHKINNDQMVTIMEVMKDTESSAPITQNFRG